MIRRRLSSRLGWSPAAGPARRRWPRAATIGREVAELRQNGLTGTPSEILEKITLYRQAGAERFYLQILDLSDLDHLRLIAETVQERLAAG